MDILAPLILVALQFLPFAAIYLFYRFGKNRIAFFPRYYVLAFGFCGVAWEYVNFYYYYKDAIAKGQWTSATLTLALSPFFVAWTALVCATLGLGAGFVVNAFIRKTVAKKIGVAGLIVLAISGAVIVNKFVAKARHAEMEKRVVAAQEGSLTSEQVAAILERYRAKPSEKDEMHALLRNPSCPEQILRDQVREGNEALISSIAVNPKTPEDLLLSFANHSSETIRYYVVGNPRLPMAALENLTKDQSMIVSRHAQRTIDYRKTAEQKGLQPGAEAR